MTSLAPLGTARAAHTMTRLVDGQYLVYVGGSWPTTIDNGEILLRNWSPSRSGRFSIRSRWHSVAAKWRYGRMVVLRCAAEDRDPRTRMSPRPNGVDVLAGHGCHGSK